MKTRDWVIIIAALVVVTSAVSMAIRPRDGILTTQAASATDKQEQVISVNGEAVLTVKPDTVVINVGVSTQVATAQASMADNANKMTALINALTAAGVKKEDIRTIRYNVSPQYDYSQKVQKLIGFTTQNSVQFSVPATTDVGKIIDQAAKAGANTIDSVSYQVKDQAKFRDEALTQAIADAKHRAEVIAKSAGITIKGVKSVDESSGTVPVYTNGVQYVRASASGMADTPIVGGDMQIRFSVRVQFNF